MKPLARDAWCSADSDLIDRSSSLLSGSCSQISVSMLTPPPPTIRGSSLVKTPHFIAFFCVKDRVSSFTSVVRKLNRSGITNKDGQKKQNRLNQVGGKMTPSGYILHRARRRFASLSIFGVRRGDAGWDGTSGGRD